MPVIKISLTEEELEQLEAMAAQENMTIQDLFRYKLLAKKNPPIFTPEEATKRALQKFSPEDPPFTLPDIYGDTWSDLSPRMTGVFGKRFNRYVFNLDSIQCVDSGSNKRRATYKIV